MEVLANEVLFRGEKYRLLDIAVMVQNHELLEFPLLIPVSDVNYVLVEHNRDLLLSALKKYQSKNLKFLFLREDHYLSFLKSIREKLKTAYGQQKKTIVSLVDDFVQYHKVAMDLLSDVGISKETIDVAKDMALYVLQVAQHNSNVFSMLHSFRSRCPGEYAKSMCVSYLVSLMLEQCSWNSKKIQEKVVLATLVCDSTLKRQDFVHFDPRLNTQAQDLPRHVFNHPIEVADKLRLSGIPDKETLTVIEEHHELPDGTGFPKKLAANTISQLSAINIVARHFVEELFVRTPEEQDMDFDKCFVAIYKRFDLGNFKQSCASLFKLLGKSPSMF